MRLMKMPVPGTFEYNNVSFKIEIKKGFLSIYYGDKIFNANGEWKFPFPMVGKDGCYNYNGSVYMIPRRFVDLPILYKKNSAIFFKRILGTETLANYTTDMVMPKEFGPYEDKIEILFEGFNSNNFLSWNLTKFPLREITRKTFFLYKVRLALFDALLPAITADNLNKAYPSYITKRLHIILTDQRYVHRLNYNTSIEKEYYDNLVINEAFSIGYKPSWYEPTIDGSVPGRKGLLKKPKEKHNKFLQANPFIFYSEKKTKRINIFTKNIKQIFPIKSNTTVISKSEYHPNAVTLMAGFVNPSDCPLIFDDALVLNKKVVPSLTGYVNAFEYIPFGVTLMVKVGDSIAPGQQIAYIDVGKERTFLKPKRITHEGIIKDIVYKENGIQLLINMKYKFEEGDKLSNLHGKKGVVAKIVDSIPGDLDILFSTSALTQSTILEGLFNYYLTFNDLNELPNNYEKFIKKNLLQTIKALGLSEVTFKDKITLSKEFTLGKPKSDVDIWVFPLNISRLQHHSSDKLFAHRDIFTDQGGIYVKPSNRWQRPQKIGRDPITIMRLKGFDLLDLKKDNKIKDYISEFTDILYPIEEKKKGFIIRKKIK